MFDCYIIIFNHKEHIEHKEHKKSILYHYFFTLKFICSVVNQ